MTKRNPFRPETYLPRTGNPYIDGQVEQGLRRLGNAVFEAMNPDLRAVVGTVASALAGAPTGAPPGAGGPNPLPQGVKDGQTGRDRFIQELLRLPDGLFVTLGRRGSGKTALNLKLAQEYHQQAAGPGNEGRPVFVIGMPQRALTRFGFKTLSPDAIDTIPNGSVLVIDDVALFFSNRDYAKAERLHQAIIESRHRHIIIIVNAHNSALIDKYLFEATVLFLKPSSGISDDLQRSGIRQLVARANDAFTGYDREAKKALVYAFSDELDFEGMLRYTPPKGWTQSVSEHHAAQ